MKNEVKHGDRLTLTAPYARSAGEGALVGSIFGVALNDVANAADGVFLIEGVFDIAKATGAISQGAKLYWDNTNKNLTTTASGNTLVGVATQAQLSGDATARIRLGIVA